ncbi:MAG: ArnT family glycosyltransferase [Flavisolibacter sp.]
MQLSHPVIDTHSQSKIDTRYRKKFFVFTGVLFVIKIILAFVLELGNDEAYYWLYSQYWQWNYFDHPPMVAVWIRLFTANLSLQGYEGFLRLGSVTGCVLASWFLFKAVSLLHSEKAGWLAVIMYNISFYSGITAGLYIMPDSPEMVFWTLALLLIVRITKNDDQWANWILFGLVAGLCIMSKIHGAFLWLGLGGYTLFQKRAWLRKPQFYLALLITLAIISPILFWNLQYNFITFRFHSKRVDINLLIPHARYFFKELGSQIGFNNPVNYFLILSALVAFYRKRISFQPALAIFNFTGLPLSFLLLFIALFRNVTLPHWSGPAYVSLLPLGAIWLAGHSDKPFPNILRWGTAAFLLAYLAYGSLVKFYPGTYGSHDQNDYGRGDITLDMYGWKKASTQFDSLYRADVAGKAMPANAAMITTKWWGAHVDYYFARPLGLKMIGVGDPTHLHEYLWTNRQRKSQADLDSAYCIIPADDRYNLPSDVFQSSELALTIGVERGGKLAHQFFVYRLRGLKKEVPVK